MTGLGMRVKRAVCGIAALTLLTGALTTGTATAGYDTSAAKAANEQYRDVDQATADGFGALEDLQHITCIDSPSGAMGIHYVLGSRVGDWHENATAPEALIYEPTKNGRLRLVAVEYVVLKSSWEGAGNTTPPSLFGQPFTLVAAGNRYGLPDFYELHAWLFKHNPAGMFEDWNPRVSCSGASED